MELKKEDILKHDKEIFQFYIPEWKEGRNFISPFREETSPSASLYINSSNTWTYKDFGNGDSLNPVDFVMKKFNINFSEALKQIDQDLRLGLNTKSIKPIEISYSQIFKAHELKYFKQYGITEEILKKYNVVSVDSYIRESKEGKQYTIKSSASDFILGYKVRENYFKLYRPNNKDYKFTYLGIKPLNYVFGYSELPEKFKYVFFAAGEKDTLTLIAHGYPAICLNSESANPTPELIKDLKSRFENVILIYDLDEKCKRKANELCSRYGLKYFNLPEELFTKGIGKDASDYFKASLNPEHKDFFNIEAFDSILNDVLNAPESQNYETVTIVTPEENPLLTRLESLCFNSEVEVPEPIPVISIEGNIISTAGNITVFKGQSKAGKSGNLNGIIGGILAPIGAIVDTLGYEVKKNPEGKLLLHVDTEQSAYNHFRSVKNILKRCNKTKEPVWFKSLLLRELAIKERKQAIELYIDKYAAQFSGVHTIIIDGIADFVNSVNDEQECNEVIHFFEKLAIKYSCPVITIIHLNPSSETKGRGHLDSQLERKAESILNIKKDKDTEISTIEGVYFRNAGSTPILQFRYDQDKGYHVSCGIKITISKQDREYKELQDIANDLFIDPNVKFTAGEIVEALKESLGVEKRAAETKRKSLISRGFIEKEPGHYGKYYLCSCASVVHLHNGT